MSHPITLIYSDGGVRAIGQTRFDPELHVLCEGSEADVLRILISIYCRRDRRLGPMLRRVRA